MQKSAKDSGTQIDWTQPVDLMEFANSYIHKLCVCCSVLWTWPRLWPAAIEMCLFNRQIEFMASFSTTRLPLCFQEEGIRSLHLYGGGLVSSPSLSLISVDLSCSCPSLRRPRQLSLSRSPRPGLVSSPLHLLSSPILSSRPLLSKFPLEL